MNYSPSSPAIVSVLLSSGLQLTSSKATGLTGDLDHCLSCLTLDNSPPQLGQIWLLSRTTRGPLLSGSCTSVWLYFWSFLHFNHANYLLTKRARSSYSFMPLFAYSMLPSQNALCTSNLPCKLQLKDNVLGMEFLWLSSFLGGGLLPSSHLTGTTDFFPGNLSSHSFPALLRVSLIELYSMPGILPMLNCHTYSASVVPQLPPFCSWENQCLKI